MECSMQESSSVVAWGQEWIRSQRVADVLYDLGTAMEVISPLCPQLFLEVVGLGNFAKGMAVVGCYRQSDKAANLFFFCKRKVTLSDLFAKGESISTLYIVMVMGAGIGLASTVCSTTQGKCRVERFLAQLS